MHLAFLSNKIEKLYMHLITSEDKSYQELSCALSSAVSATFLKNIYHIIMYRLPNYPHNYVKLIYVTRIDPLFN